MFRVLTFNILTGRDLRGHLDLGRTADVIAAARPDIVGLQEVDRHFSERSAWADQPAELAERLGWTVGFAPGWDDPPPVDRSERRQFGEAILTPHRVIDFAAHQLTNLPSDHPELETRGAAQAVIEIAGRTVTVVNTHLDHLWSEQREHQAGQVNRLVSATTGPAIVMGDFNAGPDDPELMTISSGFVDAARSLTDAAALTFPSNAPKVRLDYVFVRHLQPISAAVLDVRASDHRPLLVEVDWTT